MLIYVTEYLCCGVYFTTYVTGIFYNFFQQIYLIFQF